MLEDKDSCIYHNKSCEDKTCNGFGERIINFDSTIKKLPCLKYLSHLSVWRHDLMIPEYIENRRIEMINR